MLAFLFSLNLWAMPANDYQVFQNQLEDATYTSDKLALIELVVQRSTFTSSQVKSTIESISFNKDQLAALRLMAPTIEDPDRSYVILDAFSFSSAKQEAQKIIMELVPKKSLQQVKEEEERQREEDRNRKLEEISLEEGPVLRWVGRCRKGEQDCVSFNPKLFSPVYKKQMFKRFPSHSLMLEVSGPGNLEIEVSHGPRFNCKTKRSRGKRSYEEWKIPLEPGVNVVNIEKMVKDWKRKDVEIRANKGYQSSSIRLRKWKRCP
ncbi:MAG: DUF4476 domain-containing protein [Myxococcota bacterium]|nr:DUF4476 domain-containing protein [Myxococcota bacterium]